MRKCAFVLALVISLMTIAGCGSNSTNKQDNVTVTDNRSKDTGLSEIKSSAITDNRGSGDSATEEVEAPPVNVSDKDFEVEGHLYETKLGTIAYSRYFLIITSHAQAPVRISANATAKDSGGNAIGADSTNVEILGPNETTIAYFYFEGVSGIESVDYQLSYDTNTRYYPVIANLDMQQTLNDKNTLSFQF